jgi:hypothetical protein
MEAWPPLAVEQPSVVVREGSQEEVAGQPLLCVVRRTATMCDLEQRLRFAMVSSIGGRRPVVSCEQVLAALRWRGVPEGTVSVHAFAPEDFLVVFESEELRNHVAGLPPVLVAGAPLSLRPWNHQAQATLVPLKFRVVLVIEGIPPHAWDTAVVEDTLGKSCAVDEVAPEMKARSDLSLFKLLAWTSDLEAIPVARLLAVPEPVAGCGARPAPARTVAAAGEIKTLQYRVLVHVARVEQEFGSGPVRGQDQYGHGAAGPRDAGDGNGGGGSGANGAAPQRAWRDFSWKRGVPDRRRGPGGGGSSAMLSAFPSMATAAPAPEKSWALPPMCSPPPLTVHAAGTGTGLGQEGPLKAVVPTAGALPLRPTFGQRGGKEKAAQTPRPR